MVTDECMGDVGVNGVPTAVDDVEVAATVADD